MHTLWAVQIYIKSYIQVRVENVPNPEDNIPTILERVRKEYIQRTYGIKDWDDPVDFLEKLAKKRGKLLKKGEPDIHNSAIIVLNDWLRGRIPYYVPPPERETKPETAADKKMPGVEQIFKNISVSASFMEDDLKKEEEEEKSEQQAETTTENAAKETESKSAAAADEPTDWDEIFESVVGEEGPVAEAPVIEGEEEEEAEEDQQQEIDSELELSDMGEEIPSDDEEEEEEVEEQQPARKKSKKQDEEEAAEATTPSKKKKKIGVHYYETANVKNRNRNKAKPDETAKKVLHSRLKGSAQAGSKRKRR